MRPEMRAGLWAVFALIMLAGGWLFLRACGTWPVFGWQRNYCPAPVDRRAYAREVAIGEGLRREVHAAEMALAEKPPCPTPVSPPSTNPPARRQSSPLPVPTPQQRRESSDLDRKVEERHGKRGKLQFTLSWNTLDDLDLNVECPGGVIMNGHFGPGVCGDGIKDIDANRNLTDNVSNDPIENVSWANDAPPGRYKIVVVIFLTKNNDGTTIPFTLRMRWGDQEKTCRDVVTRLPASEIREVNGETLLGTARTIVWESTDNLPECAFTVVNSTLGRNNHK